MGPFNVTITVRIPKKLAGLLTITVLSGILSQCCNKEVTEHSEQHCLTPNKGEVWALTLYKGEVWAGVKRKILANKPYPILERGSTVQILLCMYVCMSHTVHTIQYNTEQYSTVQYSTVQYSTVQYSTVQYSCTNQKRGWYVVVEDVLGHLGLTEWETWVTQPGRWRPDSGKSYTGSDQIGREDFGIWRVKAIDLVI